MMGVGNDRSMELWCIFINRKPMPIIKNAMCIHILYLYTVNSSSTTSPYNTFGNSKSRFSPFSRFLAGVSRHLVAFIRENTVCRTIDDTRRTV